MSAELSKAPIFYTIGQVRFSAVLEMKNFIADIQSALRRSYPDFLFDESREVQLNFAKGENNPPEVKTLLSSRWHFKNEEQTAGYILMVDSLIFHTTAYGNSETFIQSLISGLRVVHEEVGLSFIEGVGFRMLDAIIPSPGQALEKYLNERLLGIADELSGVLKHSISETVLSGEYGQLITRVASLKGKIGIPIDLAPLTLKLLEPVLSLDGNHAVLDNDCSESTRFSYNELEVVRKLRSVKQQVTKPFYKAVSDYALKEWS